MAEKEGRRSICEKCSVTCWAKTMLLVLNTILILIGIMLFLLGLVLIMGNTVTSGYMEPLFKAGSGDSNNTLGGFFTMVSAMIITLGIIVFSMGVLGCCGIKSRSPRVLNVYAGILIFLLVAEIISVILCATMTSWVNDKLSDGLLKTIEVNYAGSDADDSISAAWNYAFVTFECCGNHDYKDLHSAVKWNRTNDIIPVTCCVLKSTGFPDYGDPKDPYCTTSPTTTNSNAQKGCFQAIKDRVKRYLGYIIGIAVSILCIQVTLIISAFWVSRKRKKTAPN